MKNHNCLSSFKFLAVCHFRFKRGKRVRFDEARRKRRVFDSEKNNRIALERCPFWANVFSFMHFWLPKKVFNQRGHQIQAHIMRFLWRYRHVQPKKNKNHFQFSHTFFQWFRLKSKTAQFTGHCIACIMHCAMHAKWKFFSQTDSHARRWKRKFSVFIVCILSMHSAKTSKFIKQLKPAKCYEKCITKTLNTRLLQNSLEKYGQ